MKKTKLLPALILAAALGSSVAAETSCPSQYLVCNSDQGSVLSNGSTYDNVFTAAPTETDVITGEVQFFNKVLTSRSFLLFDIGNLEVGDITTDTIVLSLFDVKYKSFGTGLEDFTIAVYDIDNTDFSDLEDPAGFTNRVDVFEDLGSSIKLGSTDIYPTANIGSFDLFEIELDSASLIDAVEANKDTFGLGLSLESKSGSNISAEFLIGSSAVPSSGINKVPEVSATGALAAFGSLFAMMVFLWERRRVAHRSAA